MERVKEGERGRRERKGGWKMKGERSILVSYLDNQCPMFSSLRGQVPFIKEYCDALENGSRDSPTSVVLTRWGS